MKPTVEIIHKGEVDYKFCWDFQTDLFNSIVQQKITARKQGQDYPITPNYLIFCSHPHVYTLGKTGERNHLLINDDFLQSIGASYYHINRGGDITYHGPGQLVAYPIFNLDMFFTDISRYLRTLEEAVIKTIADWGIVGERIEDLTGVWIDGDNPLKARKICAMGVKLSRWVTMHGLALNVNSDLSYFNHIVPCGITDKAVTSMEKELGVKIDQKKVEEKLLHHLKDLFQFNTLNA